MLYCLSLGMYAHGVSAGAPDSTSVSTFQVVLSEFSPDEIGDSNRFKFDNGELIGGCVCENYNVIEVDSLASRAAIDSFVNGIRYFGIVPDIIETAYISDVQYLKQSFEDAPIYKAEVLYKGEPLSSVSWKEFPHLKTSGVFRTSDSTLTPQRRGYMFSPDIYNFTDKNTRISGPKLFRAIKYNLEERLRYQMPLRGTQENVANPADHITATELLFVNDQDRGEVAYFNGASSYIDIRSDFEEKLEEISITGWIKPETVEGSLSLVGKGEVFSAKIFNGRLQFTTIGIEDHTTSDAIVEEDVWSHIAMVYVPRQQLYFYLNGELIQEVPASDLQHADHALLIGSNLWGQNYSGLLSDLNIWKRALSDEEVKEVYLSTSEIPPTNLSYLGWLGILAFGSMLMFAIFQFRKKFPRTMPSSDGIPVDPVPVVTRPQPNRNRINLLDGFRVWNKKGDDITHRFSPKRKELVILVILYTLKEGGITSKELSDILWPGFSTQNKKNNRSTQVKEIRNIFENELEAEIVFKDKRWRFELGDGLQVDLVELDGLIPNIFSPDRMQPLSTTQAVAAAKIVSSGPLLPQVEEEWLDFFKSSYNSNVLDVLTPFMEDDAQLDAQHLQDIIEAILVVDPLFDSAVKKKVESLMRDGKYGSAKKVVENYKKLYHSYYNQHIDTGFLEPMET